MDTIKDEIQSIDKARSDAIRNLEQTIQPLARAVVRILEDFGNIKKKGWFKKENKQFNSTALRISQEGNRFDSKPIKVFYDDKLVFEFDRSIIWTDISKEKRHYLSFYNSGEWEQYVVKLYREFSLSNLHNNYGIKETDE